MKKVQINTQEYEIVKNKDDCFSLEEVLEKVTDYFDTYDYIFGDYAYDKLRLKGFNDSTSQNVRDINNIKNLDSYIEKYCAYGARYFLLKKVNKNL